MNAWDISFSSLSVGYGDHAVLHDINATLPGGKVSVILGARTPDRSENGFAIPEAVSR